MLRNKNKKKQKSFTLLELALSSMILAVIVIGLLYTYISCFELNEFSRNLTLTNNALQAQLELIRETPFDQLKSTFDDTTFTIDGFAGGQAVGYIDVEDKDYTDLVEVRLVACWRQKSGRVIGEDSDLDGVLDGSEDTGNIVGVLESPAELVTLISEID